MSQPTDRYEMLVRLAGWMWLELQRGSRWFRAEDLLGINGLDHLGGSSEAAKKARNRAFRELRKFGIAVEWDPNIAVDTESATGAYLISPERLGDREQRALVDIAFWVAFDDWDARENGMVPGAFLEGGGETVLLRSEPLLDDIADALTERRCIRLLYDDDRWRTLQPVHLVVLKGRWYLVAVDLTKGDVRNYRLSRASSVERANEEWNDSRGDFDIKDHVLRLTHPELYGEGPVSEIEVAVEPGVAVRAERLLPVVDQTRTLPDGRIVYLCKARNVDHFVSSVLALRARAEVLSPPLFRQAVIDHLRATVGAAP